MSTIAIAGAGAAGASAALTLRSAGFDGRILLFGDEPILPYRRPTVSKDLLRGDTSEDRILIKPATTWADQAVEVMTGSQVVSLDAHDKVLVAESGSSTIRVAFDQCLLATGGAPLLLPPPVLPSPEADRAEPSRVHTLRSAGDVPRLRSELGAGKHLLVIGAGLIGGEVAASAVKLGCEVTVVEAAPRPLARLFPPEVGSTYCELHRANGVRVETGVTLDRIRTSNSAVVATSTDGRRWEADVCLIAIGMRPRSELAAEAGLAVADGVVVDEFGQTSAPGIFAAGDLVQRPSMAAGRSVRIEHWQHANESGAAAARAMLGERTPFDPVPWAWSEQHGVSIQSCGWLGGVGPFDTGVRGDLDSLDATVLFWQGDRLFGAMAFNRPHEIRALRRLVASTPTLDRTTLLDPDCELSKVPISV